MSRAVAVVGANGARQATPSMGGGAVCSMQESWPSLLLLSLVSPVNDEHECAVFVVSTQETSVEAPDARVERSQQRTHFLSTTLCSRRNLDYACLLPDVILYIISSTG